jgi:signal peptidase I
MRLELSNELFFAEVEQLISQGESITFTIKGNSMRPWLQNSKHKVLVKPLADSILQCGDIALFRYKGKHILHRVVKIENDKITFSGDGNIGIKEHASKDDVIALVESIITPSGRVIECNSNEWKTKSKLWLALPQFARRIILGILRRL